MVIPYFRLHRFLEDAVASVVAQTHPRIELLVVCDGSFRHEDVVLAELATRYPLQVLVQENAGLGAARNFGISQSRGRYVLPLDADNLLEPTFAARCVAALEARRRPRLRDDLEPVRRRGRHPGSAAVDGLPARGQLDVGLERAEHRRRRDRGAAALGLRPPQLQPGLVSYEDWGLYRSLRQDGRYGLVVPEVLFSYRLRETSMLREVGLRHEARLQGEVDAAVLARPR